MIASKLIFAVFLATAIALCTVSRSDADTNYDLIDDWPQFLQSSYSSLRTPPWRESLQALLPYVSAPEIIGVYDIETIGLLWISTLQQNQVNEQHNCKQDPNLRSAEVPNHLNIYRILSWKNGNSDRASASQNKATQKINDEIEKKLYDKAVSLVRCYSQYYTPIKQKGAFVARDDSARKDLVALAGEQAVQAMDDDYINGTEKLLQLSGNQILDFRIQELNSMSFEVSDEQIQKELAAKLKTANTSDVIAIKELWKELLSRNADLVDAFRKFRTKFPNCADSDSFNIAMHLRKEAITWAENSPPVRSPGFGPLLGDGPAWFRTYEARVNQWMKNLQIRTEEFGYYDIVDKIQKLINAYLTMKLTYEELTIPSKVARQSPAPILKEFRIEFFQRAKRDMSRLVGEEAASNLEIFWKSDQKHRD